MLPKLGIQCRSNDNEVLRKLSYLHPTTLQLTSLGKEIGYLSVNSPELIFDLVNAKPGTNHSTNPTNPNGNSKR